MDYDRLHVVMTMAFIVLWVLGVGFGTWKFLDISKWIYRHRPVSRKRYERLVEEYRVALQVYSKTAFIFMEKNERQPRLPNGRFAKRSK